LNEALKPFNIEPERARTIAAQTALEINKIIENNRVVDWRNNVDIQNAMKNQIDDCLFEMKSQENINFSFGDMDSIIESSLSIARARREQ
jgi:type I restriction enzyme, R subunit